MMLPAESLVECRIDVGHDIVILPVVDGTVSIIESAALRIFLREILVGGGFSVLVVELRTEIQAV